MKKIDLFFGVVILAILFLSCGGDRSQTDDQRIAREDTVIFDVDSGAVPNPHNFNWLVPGTSINQGMHQAVWEPLFILNYETGEIMPWIGESFTPNESLDVWILKIRDGVKWHDGEAFNADDIVFTIDLLLNDKTQSLSGAANMQQWLKQIGKIDDLTIRFDLKAANPRFQLDYFSVKIGGSIVVLPEHIWRNEDPFTFTFYDQEKGYPFGTGAYEIVSASETEFIYDRRETWWGIETGFAVRLPIPKRLIWIVTGAEENRSLLAGRSKLDSVMDVTLGAFEAMQAINPNIIAWEDQLPYIWLDPCPRQLSINHTIEPWNNAEMRRALSLIIDRNEVVRIAYEGTTITSKTIFVEYSGLMPYIDAIKDLWIDPNGNVEIGKTLIEKNGWKLNAKGIYEKDGKLLSLNIQTHEGFIEKRRIADVVVEQLRSAGINATTRAIAGSTWDENKAFGNFEAVMDWDACGSVNEPWNTMNRFTTQFHRPIGERSPGNNNYVRWNNSATKRYSELVEKIGVLPLGDDRIMPLFIEAMKIYMSEQVVIPITQARKLVPFSTTYWTNWPSAKNNYNHPATWWMSTHQIILNLEKSDRAKK